MNAEKLNPERTAHWLHKTLKSAQTLGSGNLENYARQTLAQRYDELRCRAMALDIWSAYCAELGFSPDHDGYDLFA